jgi:glycerophosphoryl diester phosphodiesterase
MESIMLLTFSKSSLLKAPAGLLFASLVVAAPCFGQAAATNGSARMIMTSAHRGEHTHHPENSIPAIQGAIDAGMDYVEIDVRTTSDGQLVLMHDPSVNRMTNGKGLVKDMTLAEIRKLDLGARFPGQFPGLQVPTFDEVLEFCKGKIGIYVDTKDATPEALVAAIERHEMGKHVMFWSEHPDFLKQIATLQPAWALMPEAFNPQNVDKLVDMLHPQLLGADERDFNTATIAAAKEVNVGIFVDRQTEKEWQDAIDKGAVGIQTNFPAELTAYLRVHGYHQ